MRTFAMVLLAFACLVTLAPGAAASQMSEVAPLARLERVRGDPAIARDPAAIEALARDADAFPPGRIRVEARMLVAEAWLGRMQRPNDAIAELRLVVDDPFADSLTARLAERELVDALAASGRLGEAAAHARAHASFVDPRFARRIDRLVRRGWVQRGATGVLAAFGTLAAVALVRARRRRVLADAMRAVRATAPVAVSFATFLALAGGALATRYESGSGRPFALLGIVALPLVLVARAWGAVGSLQRGTRFVRAVLCGATLLAATFLLLDVVSPEYLEGFGL